MKYHMKRDESGVAICKADIQSCPNGEIVGHYNSEAEVWAAYELQQSEQLAKTITKNDITEKANNEILDDRELAYSELAQATNIEEKEQALRLLNMSDTTTYEKLSRSPDAHERTIAAERLTNERTINQLINKENNIDVLSALAKNPTLTKTQAQNIYTTMNKNGATTIDKEFFIKDYANTQKRQIENTNQSATKPQPTPAKPQPTDNQTQQYSQTIHGIRPQKDIIQSIKKANQLLKSPTWQNTYYNALNTMKKSVNQRKTQETNPRNIEKLDNLTTILHGKKGMSFKAAISTSNIGAEGVMFTFNNHDITPYSKSFQKHIGQIFTDNNIPYTSTTTQQGITFTFITQEETTHYNKHEKAQS